jgi:hypothetical protein
MHTWLRFQKAISFQTLNSVVNSRGDRSIASAHTFLHLKPQEASAVYFTITKMAWSKNICISRCREVHARRGTMRFYFQSAGQVYILFVCAYRIFSWWEWVQKRSQQAEKGKKRGSKKTQESERGRWSRAAQTAKKGS